MTTSDPIFPLALRDTALTVAALASGSTPVAFASFRDTCLGHIARLREELRAAGQSPDVIEDAIYAQCALLDEFALRHLKGGSRDEWEREPLQVKEFQSHDAGDALIDRIERRLAAPQPVLPLLAVFHVVIGLGFQGRFALDGATDRAALLRALDERLARAGVDQGNGPVIVTHGKGRTDWRISPVAWVALALLGAGLVYLALDRWLDAAITRLAA